MSVEAIPFANHYWAAVDELPLLELRERELRVFRAVLDQQLRLGKPFLRVTEKCDLAHLAGIGANNLPEAVGDLVRAGMLLQWDTKTGYCYQAVTTTSFWNAARRLKVDRTAYNRVLYGLRSHNAVDHPDPQLPHADFQDPKQLTEVLGDTLAPTRPLEGSNSPGDYHQDRGNSGDARCLQGDSRESVPANAVQTKGAVPPQGGAAALRENSERPSELQSGDSNVPSLFCAWCAKNPAEFEYLDNWICSGCLKEKFPSRHTWERLRVLESSTHPSAAAPRKSPPLLESSTGARGAPPDEYSNRVLARLPLLDSSTPPNNDIIEQCSNASKKHLTLLTMFMAKLRSGEVTLERGATPRQLAKYLELAGVFVGPAGEYYAPFWFARVKDSRQAVEDCLFHMVKKLQEEGVHSIETAGKFMRDSLKRCGSRPQKKVFL
jgi:hypothetical protein